MPDNTEGDEAFSGPMFDEIQRRQSVFSGVFAWSGGGVTNFEVNRGRFAGALEAVSGEYFLVLGVQPSGSFYHAIRRSLDNRRFERCGGDQLPLLA